MPASPRSPLALLGLAVVLAGSGPCSRTPAASHSAVHRASNAAAVGSACDRKLLTVADVGGILTEPIVGTEPVPGAPTVCHFTTGSFPSIEVTVTPGTGRASLAVWKSGRMPSPAAALTGVGDEAVWVPDLNEVVAEKDDLLCDIAARGAARDLAGDAAMEQRRLGGLCNKIFAAAAR